MNIRSAHRSTKFAAALVAASFTWCAAGATAATSDTDVLKQVVRYGDLNLERTEGITVLYQRVNNAAVQVCRPLESRGLAPLSAWKSCVAGAVSRAVTRINVPALTAYANARGVRVSPPILAARTE